MTRVFPLPAPARISTGPSVVSTASRCCGFSSERNDNEENRSGDSLTKFYRSDLSSSYFEVFLLLALLARANLLQPLPGVNPELVSVVPFEFDRVLAHAFC